MDLSQINQAVPFREEKTGNSTAVSLFWLTRVKYTCSWKMPSPTFHLLAQHLSFPYKHDRWCDRGYPDRKNRVPRDLDDPDSSPTTHSDWMRENIKVTFSSSGMLNILTFHLIFLCLPKRNVLLQLPKPNTYVCNWNSKFNVEYQVFFAVDKAN